MSSQALLAEARRKELAQEYADRAMALLKQAVRSGYQDVKALREHKDLELLRQTREDFPKLLQELDEKRNP